jgi:predicted site-specific integrase-resolvase
MSQKMTTLSTQEFISRVGISRATLERWLVNGKVKKPKMITFGKSEFRSWTAEDLKRVQKYKRKNYRKGRGRKAKPKR